VICSRVQHPQDLVCRWCVYKIDNFYQWMVPEIVNGQWLM
jgi:hypothetical protein